VKMDLEAGQHISLERDDHGRLRLATKRAAP